MRPSTPSLSSSTQISIDVRLLAMASNTNVPVLRLVNEDTLLLKGDVYNKLLDNLCDTYVRLSHLFMKKYGSPSSLVRHG